MTCFLSKIVILYICSPITWVLTLQIVSSWPVGPHLKISSRFKFDFPSYSLILSIISDWKKKIHWSVLGEKRGKLFDKIISLREEAEDRKKSSFPFYSWYQDFEQTRTSISEKNRMKKMILGWRLGTAGNFHLETVQNFFPFFITPFYLLIANKQNFPYNTF